MFSSCKESVRKSLIDHLLKDGSRLEDGVPGPFMCSDSPQTELQAWIRVRVGAWASFEI